ncbi:MAG: YDG domain-containing protein, partial [Ferruginibacter sp.]
ALNNPTSFSSSSLPVNGLSLAGAVISGTPTTATAPGTENVNITATNGLGSDNQVLAITVNKGSQTITGLPATDTKTFGDAAYNLTATGGASGNPVTYNSLDPLVATTTGVNGATITIVGAGTATIVASQTGNANYNAAADVSQTLTVNQASQTITFGTLADKNDVDANFQLTATGGASGNPVTYVSSNTSVAIIVDNLGNPDVNGSYVDIVGPGTTTITASQAGNTNYSAATPVPQNLLVNNTSLLPQTITGHSLTDTKTYGAAPYNLTATGGGSGNPVTYNSDNPLVATTTGLNGATITIVGAGTANITASQAGNGSYNPAPDVIQALTVLQKDITVSGAVADNKPYDGTNTATITGGSLQVLEPGDVVTFSGGGTFSSSDAGTWPVTTALVLGGADQAKYNLIQPAGLTATISQLSQTITGLPATDTRTFGAAPYNLTATGGASGNPVTYNSSDPLVATTTGLNGATITIVGAGTTVITASQAGNTNYSAAADVFQTLTVNQANQTITFAALPTKTTADVPFNLTGTASSGLTVSYSSSNPAVADVVGNLVTIYTTGTTIITASQAGNANYLPATNVARTLNVTAPLIAAWDFTGETSVVTSAAEIFNANLSSSNLLTRGAGAAASAGGNSFRTTGFQNNGISTANTDYFQATLAAAAGKTLSISDITAKFNGTSSFYGAPGVSSQFAYSLDGTNFTLIGSPELIINTTLQSSPPIDVTGISALQNVPSGTTVTIRYYASGQTGTGGWGFFSSASGDYGLTFGGYVASAPPVVTYVRNNVSACGSPNDGSITTNVTGDGPFTYSWTGMTGPGAATPFTAGNVSSITNLAVGYYNVTVTDANLTSTTINGIHVQNAFLVNVTNNGSISSSCGNTGSIILYGNAGVQPYTYSLDGITYQPGNTFTGLAAGTYTGYVKDAAGCVGTKPNIVIAAAPAISVSPFARNASSCANDGSIEIYRSGGVPPYQYSLDNITYQVSNVFSGLAAGSYTAYVKDSKDCVGSQPVTISQGPALNVTVNKTNASSCENDGTIRVFATGGSSPYTYSIDDVTYGSSNLFAGLSASNYTVYVKDVKGCTGSLNVTISLNEILVTAYATAASSCASSNGSIQLFRTGGVGPYTYSLDGMTYQASSVFTGLVPGYYEGFVKDSKTCTASLIDIYVGPDCGQRQITASKNATQKVAAVNVPGSATLKVTAYPNPTTAEFMLNLEGYGTGKVAVIVTDIMGRKVFQAEGNARPQYRFGNNFNAGIYNVQVIQGTDKQNIKIVKE